MFLLLDHIARTTYIYVDAACCYRQSSVVCQFVCRTSEPCKNGWTDRDAVWVEDSEVGLENHVLDGGPDPLWEWAILGEGAAPF